MPSSPRHRRLALLVALLVGVGASACEHPIAIVTPHVEAQDALVFDTTGRLMARTFDNRRWEGGPFVVRDRGSLPVIVRFRGSAAVIDANRRHVGSEHIPIDIDFLDAAAAIDAGGSNAKSEGPGGNP